MKLSTKITYGVRAIFDIAYHASGMPAKVKDIARRQGISPRYIEQIFIKFKQHGIIKTMRGPNGGYLLANEPSQISLGDIIRAIEGNIELVSCKSATTDNADECSIKKQCVTAPIWNELNGQISSFFDSITIQDLCERGKGLGIERDINTNFRYH